MMLTRRQHEVFSFLEAFIDACGFAPSFDEIMEACGISSKGSVHRYLGCLERKGYIRRRRGEARAISLCNDIEPSPEMIKAGMAVLRACQMSELYHEPEKLAAKVYRKMQAAR